MFIGHFGVGFASKEAAPRTSLGTLFLAAQFLDLLWPTLLLLGVESVRIAPGDTAVTPLDFTSYPISHSLAAAIGWGVLFAIVYRLLRNYQPGAIVAGLAVLSHWVLDFLTHRPDLPIYPSGPKVGLGLWNSVSGTVIVEGAIFAAGVALYLHRTRAKDRTGSIALWSLIVLLVAIYASNLVGPPPPSVKAIAILGEAQWLIVAWGYWIDAHRELAGTRRDAMDASPAI
ncbi:MAG: metal-dependent hydrolase [Thermoanaerobaculia bacterium]